MNENRSFRPITENYAVVATLPVNFFSESAPSKTIERLLTKRDNAHKSVLKFIQANFEETNLQINHEIWLESKTVKICLEKAKNDMENQMDNKIRNQTQDELVKLPVDHFQKLESAVAHYENNSFQIIDNFYETLRKLEKKRSNSFKSTLNASYKDMQKISYRLPRDILEFFEHEILRINEISLNNHRLYSTLQKDLKLQLKGYIKNLFLEMMEIKDAYYIAMKKVQVRSLVDVTHLKLDDLFDYELPREESWQFFRKLNEDVSFSGGATASLTDIEMWTKHVQITLDVLDNSAGELLELYKMAVVNVFNRFFNELQKVADALIEESKAPQLHDLNLINSEVYKPVVDDITIHYTSEVTDLYKLWNSVKEYLQSNINNTYMFLQGTAHLWDDHFKRTEDSRNLIQQDLNNHIHKNNRTAQTFERKINKVVERLRQESTIPKVDKLLEETNKILDSVAKLFSDQCNDEVKILKKYLDMINREIDVLLSEIQRFLTKFSENENMKKWNAKSDAAPAWPSSLDLNNNDFIPHQAKTCKYQVDAVNNWMFGLWEEIRIYLTTCRNEIYEQAVLWVENQASKVRKRNEVRLSVHKPRYARVKKMIYEVRIKELENHRKEFSRVEQSIEKYTTESINCNKNFKQQLEDILVETKTQMKQISKKSNDFKKSLQFSGCLEQAKNVVENAEKILEENFTNHKSAVEESKKYIEQVLCYFTKSIKLFSKGGNYSREEAKTYIKKIKKIKIGLSKQYSKLCKEVSDIETEIFQKYESLKTETIQMLECSKKELDHNEKATMKIKELQSEIYRRGHAIKFRVHRVEASIDYLATVANFQLWKKKKFEVVKGTLLELLKEISELTNYLIYNNDTKHDNNKEEKCTTYVCGVKQLINNSLENIKVMAKDFYQTHGPILNKGRVQPTYESFMQEIAGYYEKYNRQVEIHCLECAEDLVNHILKFLKINDEIYEGLVQKYPNALNKEENNQNYNELCKKLSDKSLDIQKKRTSLEKLESDIGKDINRAITDIIQDNNHRESTLHELINELLNHVKSRLYSIETISKEEGKVNSNTKNVLNNDINKNE